jgi:hypothetical protein
MADKSFWWREMPPCGRCGVPHVLTDCAKRLPFEAGRSAS